MCAINGITAADRPLVLRMNEATKHRGPDGTGVWVGEGVTLGHNRLAIIDLDPRSSQPMHSNDGRHTIVFNGEIYNYRELREELKRDYEFKTESDTEVLLAAYRRWGTEMFSKLRGIFALGLWDAEEGSLLLVRDHMGVKPLYYSRLGTKLVFSSEIPGMLESLSEKRLSKNSLAFYLTMEYVPSPGTLIEGVKKLPPAHMLVFKDGKATVKSFIATGAVKDNGLYESIDTAVKRQLVSDRPIGAYLSGGFDSSIIVHHMKQHTNRVRTYSVDFEAVEGQEHESLKFNADARLAEKTAACFSTEHKTFTLSLPEVRRTIPEVLQNQNEPIANSTAVTQYLLSDFVRKDGVIVVLGGDGGDELFGGYTRHRIAMGAHLYQTVVPRFMRTILGGLHPRLQKLDTPFGSPLHRALMVEDEKKIHPFLQNKVSINTTVSDFFTTEYEKENETAHPLDKFMRVDRRTWLPDECFIRSDYASMAHGIELRVPFVDIDLVALSDTIAPWKKTLPHEGKRIIRKTYKEHLPSHLYNEPKRGWLSPAAKWFRDPEIYTFVRNVFSSGYYSGLDEIFDWNAVQSYLEDHVEKRGYYLYPLWNILALQVWAREHRIEA